MAREFYGATVQAQRAINKLLSLPASGREQDWEIELADPNRIEEMIETAENTNLNYDERCALALIMISSIEEWSEVEERNLSVISRIKYYLDRDRDVRDAMAFYWIGQRRASNGSIAKSLFD